MRTWRRCEASSSWRWKRIDEFWQATERTEGPRALSQLGDDVVVRSVEGLLEGRAGDHPRCLNCEATLHGAYCAACGQKVSGIEVSLGEFAREALDNVFSFDSRVWRTLRLLLWRPGFLTTEYWAGRRARYVTPLRLYLFVSFFTFLVLGLVGDPQVVNASADWQDETGERAMVQVTSGQEGEIDWEEDLRDAPAPLRWFTLTIVRPLLENQERSEMLFLQRMPWAIFLMVPFFAGLLKLLFRRQKRLFVVHLVFSLHLHAAVFFFLGLGALGDWAASTEMVSDLLALAILLHFVLSLRRAYRDGWLRTLAKAFVLLFVHILALAFVLVATISITALTL